MARRPAFLFFPADWRGNAKLRRCSEAARGAWVDVLCILHDSDEYGVARYPLAELARAAGVPLRHVKELVAKNVLKGADKAASDYVWAPTHAGKKGEDVVLVQAGDGACWYSTRLVRDEYVRQRRGSATRFSPENQPKGTPKAGIGARQGDGPSFASAFSEELPVTDVTEAVASPPALLADPIWGAGLAFLRRKGMRENSARALLGKLRQSCGDVGAAGLLAQAEADDITDPASWLMAACKRRPGTAAVPLLPRDARSEAEQIAANEAALARLGGLP